MIRSVTLVKSVGHETGKPIGENQIRFEDLSLSTTGGTTRIVLPELSLEERETIDPIIPPTSGIRIKLLEQKDDGYTCLASKYTLFLRLFKAISIILKREKSGGAKVLITSDERPTSDRLLKHAMRVLASDGHAINVQHEREEKLSASGFHHSGVSTPYSSACIALFLEIDAVITVTASHNSATWNGIKYYHKLPIPIAGDLMKEISRIAISLDEILLEDESKITLNGRDYESIVNDYVKRVISGILPVERLAGKPVVLWPYMGKAKGLHDLLTSYGVNVIKIDKTMEPPDPTVNFNINEVKGYLDKFGANLAILLDADRDRIVFLIKHGNEYIKLNPNELYTAMHNILSKLGKRIINVRTVPSDPRCDQASLCTIESGVGYKHLGIIQFVAAGKHVDASQFESALIYGKELDNRTRLNTRDSLLKFLDKFIPRSQDAISMVLWEESGGHTVNLVKPVLSPVDGSVERLEPVLPLIGDKFPAPAIVILSELIERGYDLVEAVDTSIIGSRMEIDANDERKREVMRILEKYAGTTITIGNKDYNVVDYRDNSGMLDIIAFVSRDSISFARPSGTGNNIRIYIFGNKSTTKDEIKNIAGFIQKLK